MRISPNNNTVHGTKMKKKGKMQRLKEFIYSIYLFDEKKARRPGVEKVGEDNKKRVREHG